MWITINIISLTLSNNWRWIDKNVNPPYCLTHFFCKLFAEVCWSLTIVPPQNMQILLEISFFVYYLWISYLWALDLLSRSGKWRYMEEPVLQSRPARQSVLWFGRDQFMSQKGLFLAVWLIYKKQEKKWKQSKAFPNRRPTVKRT